MLPEIVAGTIMTGVLLVLICGLRIAVDHHLRND